MCKLFPFPVEHIKSSLSSLCGTGSQLFVASFGVNEKSEPIICVQITGHVVIAQQARNKFMHSVKMQDFSFG